MPIFSSPLFKGYFWVAAGLALVILGAVLMRADTAGNLAAVETSPPAETGLRTQAGAELSELERAARGGDVNARLALARQYAQGDGVERSAKLAFRHYEILANQFPDIDPMEPRASAISEAFRNLSELYRKGVPELNLEPDPAYALSLLHHSASYFGDPIAQYLLAKHMLEGEAEPNPRIAMGWLLNASRKRYAPAQARLGEMLWRGEQVKRATGDGLALMAVALENAAAEDRDWIAALFGEARAAASGDDLRLAAQFIERNGGFLRHPSRAAHVTSAEMLLTEPSEIAAGQSDGETAAAVSPAAAPRAASGEARGAAGAMPAKPETATQTEGPLPARGPEARSLPTRSMAGGPPVVTKASAREERAVTLADGVPETALSR